MCLEFWFCDTQKEKGSLRKELCDKLMFCFDFKSACKYFPFLVSKGKRELNSQCESRNHLPAALYCEYIKTSFPCVTSNTP